MTKSPDAFRTISEVAEDLDLPQHVLRFWESRFSQIKPMKRGGGRRYYRPDDVDLLRGIRHLLYDEGYTIRGVQRLFKDHGVRFVIATGRGEDTSDMVARPAPASADNGGKQAVPVSQITAEAADEAGPGLLDRLRGKDKAGSRTPDGLSISDDERRSLQATLYELLECKRLLDQVR